MHKPIFDQDYIATNNLNLLGKLLSITREDFSKNFGLQAMLGALSRSKAIANGYIDNLDISKMVRKLATSLQIGLQLNSI